MSWQKAGALSGVGAAILFLAAFVIFLAQGPTGSPRIPNLENAGDIIPYIEAHKSSMRVEWLLNSLGVVAFLWFLSALWSRFSGAASERGRVVMLTGGITGASAVLAGTMFIATALLLPVEASPILYALGVVSIGFGSVGFTLFFGAAAKVILETRVLPAALGYAAIVAGVAAAVGFVTLFADSGIFNAATGAIGNWARFGAFVIWIALASLAMGMKPAPRRRTR